MSFLSVLGKTTLLNILGTIDKATSGTVGALSKRNEHVRFNSVEILGQVVDSNSTDEYLSQLRLEKIGMPLLLSFLFTVRLRVPIL